MTRYGLKLRKFFYLSSGSVNFADNFFSLLVKPFVRIALNSGDGDSAVDVQVLFPQVNAGDGDVRATLPRSDHRFERSYLRVRAGLVSVEPRGGVLSALVLDLALPGTLAPATLELLV